MLSMSLHFIEVTIMCWTLNLLKTKLYNPSLSMSNEYTKDSINGYVYVEKIS